MAKGFKHGAGGGTSLNFKVVGNPQPENSKENTIWVDTDEPITGWGFSTTNPFVESVEIYTSVGAQSGVYIDQDGSIVSSANMKLTTDKIPLPEKTVSVTITANSTVTTAVSHAFYDESGNLMSTVKRQTGTVTYDVPAGAKSIRIGIYNGDKESLLANIPHTQNGDVWVGIDVASTRNFNALKKNNIQVYPVSAKQYVSGEWVNKTAKIYKGGEWLDFSDGYLYKRGTWYNGIALDETFTHGSPTLKYNDDAIRVTLDSYEMTYRCFQNKEDFTGKTKLSAKFYSYQKYTGVDSSDNAAGIRMMVTSAKSHNNKIAMSKIQNLNASTAYNLELDVSSISGEYYVLFLFNRNNSGTLDVDMQEVRLQ